jgi:hypothetical protein
METPYADRRSLADAHPGEAFEILQILFDEPRARCARRGLKVGTRGRCRRRGPRRLLLDLPDGRAAAIDRRSAGFVEVAPLLDAREPGERD